MFIKKEIVPVTSVDEFIRKSIVDDKNECIYIDIRNLSIKESEKYMKEIISALNKTGRIFKFIIPYRSETYVKEVLPRIEIK